MNLRSILRDGLGSISRRSFDPWRRDRDRERGRSASFVDLQGFDGSVVGVDDDGDDDSATWRGLPPELLMDVVKRVEESEAAWPARKHVVACASVCRSWRHVCKEIVGAPEATGKLTFPVSLKQPGPRSGPIQCYIKRNKSTSTYKLFLGLNTENGKFLMAARKIRRPTHSEYIIAMAADDISRNSVSYMGKLRSNFLGTKFALYDSQPPYSGAVSSSGHSSRRFHSRKVSPKVSSGNYGIAQIAYELNMLGTRGPRRMRCVMNSIPASALEPNGSVPSYHDLSLNALEESFSSTSLPSSLDRVLGDLKTDSSRLTGSTRFTEVAVGVLGKDSPLVLKNKAPRWHEQLQCWCLNFRGRVTIASVKNFQLIAACGEPVENTAGAGAAGARTGAGAGTGTGAGTITGAGTGNDVGTGTGAGAGTGSSQSGSSTDHDKIILQFGKIGKDLFTVDYRYPLSVFQAFGICLSSFDSKLACE